MSSSVPSFSSFPDFEAGTSTRTADPSTSSHDRKKKRRPHSSERKSDAKSSKSRHKSSEKERRSRKDVEEPRINRDRELDTVNLTFYSDRKGDSKNIEYGGLYAGDVPKYRLVAGGRHVLGLSKALVIVKRYGKGVEVGISRERKAKDLTSSTSRALLSKPPTRRLGPSSKQDQYTEVDGVIRLSSRRIEHGKEESYRLDIISHRDDSDSFSSSDEVDESSSDEDSDRPVLTAHQETLKQLEQELDARPDNVETWKALLHKTLSTTPITSKNALKARSEITLSLLTRAFSKSPHVARNKYLRLTYLQAGEQVWHESKLKAEWDDALRLGGSEIQIEWLEWRIKTGNGGIDQVIDAALRVCEGLGSEEDGELAKTRVFWRVAIALRDAGYGERATAMFQAQAELLFNTPRSVAGMQFQAQLDELEEFWESECPRFGEEGSAGWASWYSSKDSQPPTSSQNSMVPKVKDLDPYRQWAVLELETDRTLYLPLKSDSDSSDPYATVLFADIRSMMLKLTSRPAKHAFRVAWLSFMGLHVPGFSLAPTREVDWDDRWNLSYLTRAQYLNAIFPPSGSQSNITSEAVAGVLVGREREYTSPFGPVRCWSKDVSLPLDLSSAEPGKVLQWGLWAKRDLANIDDGFLRRLFTGLRMGSDDPEWDTLALAFELAANAKGSTKVSKSLLATNQGSLLLWNAHAQLERRRGRADNVRKLYETVLVSAKPPRTQNGVGRLFWNWVEMEWLAGDDQRALDVALRSVDLGSSISGVTILRAKRSLEDAAEAARASSGWKEQEAWLNIRAVLELLTGNGPDTAFTVFDRYIPLENDATARESLTTASLVMMYCYGTILKRPMPPSILRDRAHVAFSEYPSNSIILGILLETEKGQGVWGRVRTMLGSNDDKVKDVARRIEEVWLAGWETGRWLSEVERTRNGLAAAVEHERTRCSFVIWRIYIEFEIRLGELQRAKKLLFRAISDCPLVKELYLIAFGPLRSVFKNHELQALADTMVERGIRLRQGLDEALQGQTIAEQGEAGSGDESGDEIEHNARELRRLMPY